MEGVCHTTLQSLFQSLNLSIFLCLCLSARLSVSLPSYYALSLPPHPFPFISPSLSHFTLPPFSPTLSNADLRRKQNRNQKFGQNFDRIKYGTISRLGEREGKVCYATPTRASRSIQPNLRQSSCLPFNRHNWRCCGPERGAMRSPFFQRARVRLQFFLAKCNHLQVSHMLLTYLLTYLLTVNSVKSS